MKGKIFVQVLFLVSVLGCASLNHPGSAAEITLQEFKMIGIGKWDQRKIESKFGPPAQVERNDAFRILKYVDPHTANQKMIVQIESRTNHISSAVWIPSPKDSEATLSELIRALPGIEFQRSYQRSSDAHNLSPQGEVLENKERGIRILVSFPARDVEAVQLF